MTKNRPSKPTLEVPVIVTLNDAHISKSREVAEQLAIKGLKNVKVLENLGAITGTSTLALLKGLRSIPGVVAAEISGEIKIAPPESDIQ